MHSRILCTRMQLRTKKRVKPGVEVGSRAVTLVRGAVWDLVCGALARGVLAKAMRRANTSRMEPTRSTRRSVMEAGPGAACGARGARQIRNHDDTCAGLHG